MYYKRRRCTCKFRSRRIVSRFETALVPFYELGTKVTKLSYRGVKHVVRKQSQRGISIPTPPFTLDQLNFVRTTTFHPRA
jgi:hypothetical protein